MKNKIISLFWGGVFMILSCTVYGQHEALTVMLEDKYTFDEIVETVELYLATAPDSYEKERLVKHFARWAYYRSIHLGPGKEFVNITQKTLEAVTNREPLPADRSANGNWVFQGPHTTFINNPSADLLGNGRADRIAFHPTNSSIIYVGTPSGGLWRTTNGGTSWTSITNFIPSLGISGIVVSHANPNTIYVLTGDGDTYITNTFLYLFGYIRLSVGVLVTHDGGTTWQKTGEFAIGEFAGFRLVQHPTNANIIMAATSSGIFRTIDGGTTWQQVHTERIYDIEFKPGDPSRVYASGKVAFIYSTDTGETWNDDATFSHSLCSNGRIELAVTPAAPSYVYLLAGPKKSGNSFCGFYRSVNSGTSFTRLCNTPNVFGDETGYGDQSEYDMAIAVNPTNHNIVVVGGLVTYRSTNGGNTFVNATTYRESGGNYIHPDIHDLAFNPMNNYLYAAGDGGFHRSTDNGVTWTDHYSGLNTAQFYHMDDYDANQYVVLAGCQDNGVKFRSSNTTNFSHIYCCDGFDVVVDYTDPYRGCAVVNYRVYRYNHFINNSPSSLPGTSPYKFFPQVELNSSNPDVYYYSVENGIAKYVVSTGNYSLLGYPGGGTYWALKTCPSSSTRIYAAGGNTAWATSGNVFMSSNGGSSWSTISQNTGFPSDYPRVTDIGVRPNSSPLVYVTFSGYTDGLKVLRSSNAGSSWTNISYDLPNIPIWSIEVDSDNNLYVGTDMGVYFKASGATAWEPFYNNLPNVPITDLAINQNANQLLAATFGRGIWKTTLRETCPPTATITGTVSGKYFRSASSSISMTAVVTGGEGTDAVLRTPGYIDLLPNFRADADPGNKFLAYIGPCDSGLPPDFIAEMPIYPIELYDYEMTFTRQEGTLEVSVNDSQLKQVVLRLFRDGDVRIIFADGYGRLIREIASFKGKKDIYTYNLDISVLEEGFYYLYLVVNDQVVHLQEVDIMN